MLVPAGTQGSVPPLESGKPELPYKDKGSSLGRCRYTKWGLWWREEVAGCVDGTEKAV